MSSNSASSSYNTAFDGFRGLAVLAVITFHARLWAFPGPIFGVDLFYSLSSFLITGSLIREYQRNGTISVLGFYSRRIRRLLPALIFMVCMFLLACYLMGRNMQRPFIEAALTVGGISNWSRALGYNTPRNLGHTWSLSLEIQFCLLWGVLCFFTLRKFRKPEALALFLGALLLFLVWHRYQLIDAGAHPRRIYNGTDTRLETFALGGAIAALLAGSSTFAIFVKRWITALAVPIGVIGLAAHLLLAKLLSYDQLMQSTGWALLVSITAVAVVVSIGLRPESWLAYPLTLSLPRFIGRISYGLYLWHYPLLHMFRYNGADRPTKFIIVLALSTIAATFSYYTVEKRFTKRSVKSGLRPRLPQVEIAPNPTRAFRAHSRTTI